MYAKNIDRFPLRPVPTPVAEIARPQSRGI